MTSKPPRNLPNPILSRVLAPRLFAEVRRFFFELPPQTPASPHCGGAEVAELPFRGVRTTPALCIASAEVSTSAIPLGRKAR